MTNVTHRQRLANRLADFLRAAKADPKLKVPAPLANSIEVLSDGEYQKVLALAAKIVTDKILK